MPASHPPENQEPRTRAGKALLRYRGDPDSWEYRDAILAIEEQAAAEARRELLAKVEGLPRYDPRIGPEGRPMHPDPLGGWLVRSEVRRLLDPSR